MDDLRLKEDLIEQYLSEDNHTAAIDVLLELIADSAERKDFDAADALRDRIYLIDPMALSAIMKASEIIESQQSAGIDKNHRELWAELYDSLTPKEVNAFHFALKHLEYGPDQPIYKQGELSARIFFINTGFAKLIYSRDRVERFIRKLGPGQIAVEDRFALDTVCTTSLITLSRVELSYLDADILNKWTTTFPLIETKLRQFASKSETVSELLKCKGFDRRSYKRVGISGNCVIQLMSPAGRAAGQPFKVEVSDISQGGMSFCARITKKETASRLLGKKLNVRYLHPLLDSSKGLEQNGTVVAIHLLPFEDCSVHLRFDNPLSERLIQEFTNMSIIQ